MKRERATHGPATGMPVQEKILVVEDNPITLKLVQVTLQKEGYVVLPAPDGKTALESAAREMPDLILQDLKLPDIAGIDLVRRLRALPGGDGVPILAFTGFVTQVEEGIIANAGFTDFLIKPVEPSRLVASVRTHLLSADIVSESPGQGRRLLLVDDDPILRKYTRLQFSNAGFDVIEAPGGQQALDQARRQKPDVVLTDVLMPGMDGFQFCYALRQDKLLRQVPVVLVSANYVEEADRRLAESIGASAYVYRSLGIKEILDAVIKSLTQQVPAPTQRDPEDFERKRLARVTWQLDRLVNLRVSILQRSYTQAAILNELSLISETLTQRRDVESALEAILAHCLDGVGLSKGLLYLVDDQGRLELRAQYGCGALVSAARDRFGQPELFDQILKAEYPIQLPSPALPETANALLVQMESESALMIPIQGKGDSNGILALFSSSLNLVQEDWVAFGRSLAAQIAQTIALSQTILKLASSEQRYRLIAEATQVVPWEADAATWQITYMAPQVETMLGYPCNDWSKPGFWADHIHAEDRDRAVNFCQAQIKAGKDHVFEYRMAAADGRIVWIRDLVSVVMQDGTVTGLRGVFVDITASKHVEQELLHYAEIAATTTDLFALRSTDNRYLVVNDQFCRYFGRTRDQIIGRTAAELFPVDQFRDVIEPYSRRCLEGETVQAEAWVDHPGVGRRYMDLQYHPFRDASGHITGLVVSGRDITERKQAEQHLQIRLEQQAALARFSSYALVERDPQSLARQAVDLCAQVLDVEYCSVLEVIPGSGTLLLRAGVGWREGLVGHATVETGEDSQAGYTLMTRSPVIVTDLRTDQRFRGPELFREHGIVSGLSVIVGDPDNPLDVLGVHTGCNRKFTLEDASFLEAVANTLAGAIIRSRAEHTLTVAQQRFSLLLNSSPSVIYATTVKSNYRCNFVSNTLEDFAGYKPEVMLSDPTFWIHQVHPDDLPRILPQIRQGIERGAATIEYRFRYKNGSYCWLRDSFRVLRDSDGKPEEVVGAWTDVTERVRMETELRASEERFRIVAVASNDLICEWNVSTGKTDWYGDIDAALGYHSGEFPRTFEAWASLVHPEDWERVAKTIEMFRADPTQAYQHEYRIRCKDGSYRIWNARGRIVTSTGDSEQKGISAVTDVTDQKLLEQRLVQSQKLEAIGQLTGGVAHDFNNRLTVILGNLELLERRLPDRDAKRLVQSALAAAEGGAELTRQLLAFSRKQVLETSVFDVNELLNESHDLLVRTLGETITVSTVCASGRCLTKSDRAQLENVILNLAVNAKHAMPTGGQLTIETANVAVDQAYLKTHAYARPGDYVLIAVSDTGTGMSEEVKRHAFEPYFTTKPQGQGTGLGLAMVYGFVKQSGGHIELYSEVGHGTSFKIYLPRHETATAANAGVPSAATHERSELLRGYTVLLVEDEAQVREIAVEILRGLECELLIASNAAEALKLFEKHPSIDLLFTDMVMPGNMSGAELAMALRTQRPDLKVLYTSGYAPHAVNGRYEINGPNDHWIAKPYRPVPLCKAVRDALLGKN